jgi:hypothetical protein
MKKLNFFSNPDSVEPARGQTVAQWMLTKPEIQALLRLAQIRICRYSSQKMDQNSVLDPHEHVKNLKRELHDATSPDQVESVRQKLIAAEGPGAYEHGLAVRRILRKTWNSEVKPAIRRLLETSVAIVQAAKANAEQQETQFFASHGLPREATNVSRRFDTELTQLKHWLDSLDAPSQTGIRVPPLPIARHGGLEWFGVNRIETELPFMKDESELHDVYTAFLKRTGQTDPVYERDHDNREAAEAEFEAALATTNAGATEE